MKSTPKMKAIRKWALIVGAAILVISVLGVGLSLTWWQSNGADFGLKAEQAQTEGAAAGLRTDQQDCLSQAAERYSQASGIGALGIANSFLGTCLPAATVTSGFCEVPEGIAGVRTWRAARCAEVPANVKSSCETLVGSVQQICARITPKPPKD